VRASPEPNRKDNGGGYNTSEKHVKAAVGQYD